VDIMLIEVAEKSGNLPDMIGLLSRWHEMSNRMLRKIRSGLILPALILILVAFLVPVVDFALGDWNVNSYLRSVARILLVFTIPAAVIFLIVCFAPKKGPVRRLLDHIVLRIPLLGKAMRNLALSRFCWAFHMLSAAGVPVTDSVQMATSVTGNAVVGDLFMPAVDSVNAGSTICEGLSRSLPLELVEMWKVGEETGQLDDVSKRLADKYGEVAEFWLGQFAFWFPRAVYALLAIYMIIKVFEGYSKIYGGIGF
ncbi:MAG: type II secretion system F family protein, partial [Phycisphaerales bacterium]